MTILPLNFLVNCNINAFLCFIFLHSKQIQTIIPQPFLSSGMEMTFLLPKCASYIFLHFKHIQIIIPQGRKRSFLHPKRVGAIFLVNKKFVLKSDIGSQEATTTMIFTSKSHYQIQQPTWIRLHEKRTNATLMNKTSKKDK
jgi:hypothetical protein